MAHFPSGLVSPENTTVPVYLLAPNGDAVGEFIGFLQFNESSEHQELIERIEPVLFGFKPGKENYLSLLNRPKVSVFPEPILILDEDAEMNSRWVVSNFVNDAFAQKLACPEGEYRVQTYYEHNVYKTPLWQASLKRSDEEIAKILFTWDEKIPNSELFKLCARFQTYAQGASFKTEIKKLNDQIDILKL